VCTCLRQLQLASNQISGEVLSKLGEAIANQRSLLRLDVSGNKIGAEGTARLASIAQCTAITSLNLDGNWMGPTGVQSLATVLRDLTALTELVLSVNNVRSGGVGHLAGVLGGCVSLKRLSLHANQIGAIFDHLDDDTAGQRLNILLAACPRIEHLDLGRNYIGNDGIGWIAGALSYCPVTSVYRAIPPLRNAWY